MTQRILLVEDEPGLVMTLTDRLTSEGYAVETAQDAETGLARATNEPFDLIFWTSCFRVAVVSTSAASCASVVSRYRSLC